jgi:hypothetical protein
MFKIHCRELLGVSMDSFVSFSGWVNWFVCCCVVLWQAGSVLLEINLAITTRPEGWERASESFRIS